MDQSDSGIENPSWEPFNKDVNRSKDQTIARLVRICIYSVIAAVIATTIQIWVPARLGISGISKDILGPIVAVIGVTFSYGFIKDGITAEFDAGTRDIESAVKARLTGDMQKNLDEVQKIRDETQKMLEEIDKSTVQYNLDFKYIAYIKPIIGFNELRLQEVSSKLTTERGENVSKFEKELDVRLESNKNSREVRYKIHSLTDEFLRKLALIGIRMALGLEREDANEKVKSGNDLHFLSLDVYAYLSAWLICSIDNDMDALMPIACIGMRHTRGDNIPDKETYKNVIQAIKKIIIDGSYTDIKCYEDTSNSLSFDCLRDTIIDRLGKLIDLIEKHPV